MKHLSFSIVLIALFLTPSASLAAYKTSGFHTTCSPSPGLARAWARSQAKQHAAVQARHKCRDVSSRAHRIEVHAKCEAPYAREVHGGIFGIEPHRSVTQCVECSADATFDCH